MSIYVLVYLGSLVLALAVTPVVIRVARRLGIARIPGARHMHTQPISHIGGVAIFLSVMTVSIAALRFSNLLGTAGQPVPTPLRVLFLAAGFMFAVGLIDDIKTKGLRAQTKFVAQIAAAILVCIGGMRIQSVVVTESLTLNFGWFSWPLTILWIVGLTNAVNLSDGLDGLAAGICTVACGVMAVFAASAGHMAAVVLMLALLGGVNGFLVFNFNPARIFMGDCGSMFLGFTIASVSVYCSARSSALVGLALPALALGIPIFDTLFSMLRRFLERRSIFSADRGHFHHRLIDSGLTQRQAVLTIYAVTLVATALGMLMLVVRPGHAPIVLAGILFLLLLVFHIVGSVRPVYIVAAFQKRRTITQREQRERKSFEEADLYFRRAGTFDQWWQAISTAADKMDFWTVDLPLVNRDGTPRALTWRQNGQTPGPNPGGLVQVHVPVRDRRSGSSLHLRIELYRNGSLESAGRRVAFFTRLIEEHDIVSLPPDGRGAQDARGDRAILYF
jgi:UDP-N-acetylmuramyl pentapeptide phosphotransferase/UDP-N-acetylglucosamine-1-phosphate transferase